MTDINKLLKIRRALTEAAFWSKVDSSAGPDACWPWTAGYTGNGYGAIKADGTQVGAHVFALFLRSEETAECVCHRCDNPKCCNPAHLFHGTTLDNMEDRDRKGRHTVSSGDNHYMRRDPSRVTRGDGSRYHKLTERDVVEVRRMHASGVSRALIAKQYNISPGNVWLVVTKKTWSHV